MFFVAYPLSVTAVNMGNQTSNTININQSVENNFLSVSDQACIASNNNNLSYDSISISNVNNSKFKAFNVQSNMSASCRMTQQISQSASSILSDQSKMMASNSSDWFNGMTAYSSQSNKSTVNQTITNNITSVSVSTCNSTNSNNITDATITASYAKGIKVNAYNIYGDMNATCVMTNQTKQQASSKMAATIKQTAQNIGMFVAIFTALFMCIAICVIGAVLIFGGGFFLLHATGHDDAIQGMGDSISGAIDELGSPEGLNADELESIDLEGGIAGELESEALGSL